MILSTLNLHERDKYINFYDRDIKGNKLHLYLVSGYNGHAISVTTLAGHFFGHFDPEKAANGILESKKMSDPEYKYYGMIKEDILKSWEKNEAGQLGTDLHERIEYFYNGCLGESEVPDTIEFQYFLMFFRDSIKLYPKLKPYRTEWFVWTNPIILNNGMERMITGSIDMTFVNDKGEIAIFDWKRVKELTYINKAGERKINIKKDFDTWKENGRKGYIKNLYGKGLLSHVPDSKYHHYCIQLNIYKYILENYYNKKVIMMNLVVCSPTEDNYLILKVDDMQDEIRRIIAYDTDHK
uniref:Exonuclease n=1 Tax=Pithovirus LCPAC101 TaxID=2506586 RepID=A0A481Z2L5_9VIRU|nr:MAG: exonuclease [Pithovirus LCPAC101]